MKEIYFVGCWGGSCDRPRSWWRQFLCNRKVRIWLTCEREMRIWLTCDREIRIWLLCYSEMWIWLTCDSEMKIWLTCERDENLANLWKRDENLANLWKRDENLANLWERWESGLLVKEMRIWLTWLVFKLVDYISVLGLNNNLLRVITTIYDKLYLLTSSIWSVELAKSA